jgi:hypothetical protein
MTYRSVIAAMLIATSIGCGDDSTEADTLGVGAECATSDQCAEGQSCLPFKGGYCGVEDCTKNSDCPEGSLCVAHDDGSNYCFRSCKEKAECNENRSADLESNCVSKVTYVQSGTTSKACVPPSSDSTSDAGK